MARPFAKVGSFIGNPENIKTGTGGLRNAEKDHRAESEHNDLSTKDIFGINDAESLRIYKGERIVREGILEKRIYTKRIEWAKRFVTLTSNAVLFAIEPGGEIRDCIKLCDISSCEAVQAEEQNAHDLIFKGRDATRKNSLRKDSMAKSPGSPKVKSGFLAKMESYGFSSPASDAQETGDGPAPKLEIEWENTISIHSERFGRTYYLRAETCKIQNEWLQSIHFAIVENEREEQRKLNKTKIRTFKEKLRKIYDSDLVQNLIAVLLVINFVINVYGSETDYPPDHEITKALEIIDVVFTVLYTIEISINMYVHWFRQFFTNKWHVFDALVVTTSLIEMIISIVSPTDTDSNLALLRLLRIFRVVRLFNKLKSLQKVILGISSTLLPMANIVIVYIVITSIYAVLATNLYAKSSPDKFGSFFLSTYSMFQVATGDAWATDVAKTLYEDPRNNGTGVLLFFISYVIAVGIILFNIIVAVLLEGFLGAIQQQEREERKMHEKFAMQQTATALDPLLQTLANFSGPHHLTSQIRLLFQLMDVDDSGTLTFTEMQRGLESLPLTPPVILSVEDWDSLTMGESLVDEDQALSAHAFQTAIRWQLQLYGQRLLAQRMRQAIQMDSDDPTTLFALKLCLMQVCQVGFPEQDGMFSTACPSTQALHPFSNNKSSLRLPMRTSKQNIVTWSAKSLGAVAEGCGAENEISQKLDLILQRSDEAISAAKEASQLSCAILDCLKQSSQFQGGTTKKSGENDTASCTFQNFLDDPEVADGEPGTTTRHQVHFSNRMETLSMQNEAPQVQGQYKSWSAQVAALTSSSSPLAVALRKNLMQSSDSGPDASAWVDVGGQHPVRKSGDTLRGLEMGTRAWEFPKSSMEAQPDRSAVSLGPSEDSVRVEGETDEKKRTWTFKSNEV